MKALHLALLLPLLICSCAPKPIWARIHGDQLSKDHSPDARQGWEDGCHSGYAAFGTNVYKTYYGFKRDAYKVGNHAYETEWYNGYNYCRQQANMMANESSILD